jgi:hypothetical protein
VLTPSRLLGYFFDISIDGEGSIGSSTEGEFLLDRLQCSGPDVFGAGLVDPAWNYTAHSVANYDTGRLFGVNAVYSAIEL